MRDGANFFPGIGDHDFVVSLVDAHVVADDPVAGEDSIAAPADITGEGDFADNGLRGVLDLGECARS